MYNRLFVILILLTLSFLSQAQNMFYHLLPGFVTAYTWVGLGPDSNWTTPENWSTSAVPGASHTAIFDDNCLANCDPTINAAINIGGVSIKNTYAGTITQGAGHTITIGASGWTQAAGTFVGSNANIIITGVTNATGGSFTAPSAALIIRNAITASALTFAHNSGTIDLDLNCQVVDFNWGTKTFNNFRIIGQCGTVNLQSSTITVLGAFDLRDTNGGTLNNGTINAQGNVNLDNYASGGTAWIRLTGGNPQSVTNSWVTGERPLLPNFEIAKNAGTVATFNGWMNFTGDYIYTSGDIVFATTQWHFVQGCAAYNIRPGTWNYPALTIRHSCGVLDLNTQTMKVTGDLTLASTFVGRFRNGTIEAYSHVTQSGTQGLYDDSPVTATLKIMGSSNQTITGSTGNFPKTEIASTGGTVSLAGTLNLMSDWTYTSGTIDAGTSTLNFIGNGTITPGTVNYYRVTFSGGSRTQNLNAGAMNVTNLLTFADSNASPGAVNNGSINASGNVVFSSFGKSGTALLNYTGNSNTTLTVAAGASTLATTHNVAKTGLATSVSLVASTSFSTVGRNFTITSGTLNVAGFAFAVNNLITIGSGGRLLCNGGTATASTWTINGEVSCGSSIGITWTGLAGDNLWSSTGNWTNNTVPGSSDVAIFNNAICIGAQCNAQINSNLSVRGINIISSYNGVLTQNSSRTLTVGTAGYSQAGGTFVGGDAAVTLNGPFILSGGTYTATSNTWTQSGNMTISGSPIFNHNSGSWITASSILISPNSIAMNNVTFDGCSSTQNLNGGTMIVVGTTTFTTGCHSGNLNSGTLEARGNIVATSNGTTGSAVVLINGTGAQSLTGSSSLIPSVQINKSSGTLTLAGTLRTVGNWTYTAGTVDSGTSTLSFEGGLTITPGSILYNNVTFSGCATTQNLNGGTMIVVGTTTFTTGCHSGNLNSGTLEARGNIVATSNGTTGSAVVLINGTGAQSLTGSSSFVPSIQINKPSGTLTLAGTLRTVGNWTYTAGTVDSGTSTLSFEGGLTITPGSILYNNVTFSGCVSTQNLNGGTMIVVGTTAFNPGCSAGTLNSGTLEARGNIVTSGSGYNGSATISPVGATSATFTWSGGSFFSSLNFSIAKTGGASFILGSNASFSTTGRNLTVTSGTLDLGGYDLSVNNILTVSSGATLRCNGGEFSAGTLSNSGTVNCPGYSTYDFNWTGAGGDSNWTTATNWQGGVSPTTTDVVVFENTYCGANCNSTVNASSSVRGVRIFSPYTGAVTQSVGANLTVGSRGWSQAAGTFTGSNSDITNNGPFNLSSGVFTSTSGTLSVGGNFNTMAGTFNHNSGTVQFTNTALVTLTPGAQDFNNVTFPEVVGCTEWSLVGSLNVYGHLLFNTSYWCGGNRPINGGTIRAYANVTSTNAGATGNTTLLISGNAAGQTITGTSGSMPGLTIAAGVHSVTLAGTIVTTGDYTVSSVGNLVTTGSTLIFAKPVGVSITPGAWAYNNVVIDGTNTFRNFDLNGNTMTIDGNLTLSGNGWGGGLRVINNGILAARGNVTVSDSGLFGTAEIHFLGNSDTTLTMSPAGNIPEGDITINKTGGGKLTLISAVRFNRTVQQDLTITSGTLDLAGYNIVVGNNISNLGTLIRGSNPGCGTITQGGAFTGNAALCP